MHRSITRSYRKHFAAIDARADRGDPVMPLTGAQRRFHHTRSADPHGRVKVVPVFVEFPPAVLSTRRLDRAARAIARRHPALRASADTIAGVPVLRIGPPDARPIVEEPTGPDAGRAARSALDHWPAGCGPFRVLVARDDRRDLLALAFDHLVCDEVSIGRVLGELAAAYDDDVEVPDTAMTEELDRYRDAVERQLDHEHEASNPDALAHWTARLRDAAPGLWGRDRRPGGTGGSESAWQRVPLSVPPGGRSRLFPTLLAACQEVLAEHDGAAPVCYTWGGRGGDGAVVGCFLNTVIANPPGELPDRLADVRAGWWDDLEWADTPFDEVVRAARAAGSRWGGHLDLVLTLDDRTRRPTLVLDGATGRETYLPGMRVGTPVVVSASYDKHELHLRVDHDPTIVPPSVAGRVTAALVDAARDSSHVAG
ncbi:condensation domain-containing protein [Actinosynnema sp. NPDC023794]